MVSDRPGRCREHVNQTDIWLGLGVLPSSVDEAVAKNEILPRKEGRLCHVIDRQRVIRLSCIASIREGGGVSTIGSCL